MGEGGRAEVGEKRGDMEQDRNRRQEKTPAGPDGRGKTEIEDRGGRMNGGRRMGEGQ